MDAGVLYDGLTRQQACGRIALTHRVYLPASPSLAITGFPRSKKGPWKALVTYETNGDGEGIPNVELTGKL